jgi:hypothetical protein
MATDWQELAKARQMDIPKEQIDVLTPTLAALESAFRLLVAALPGETPSTTIFRAGDPRP